MEERKRNLLKKRINYKPFEYPEVMDFVKAINNTFWVHEELLFTADVQDFHSQLNDREKEVVKRALLAVAQLEVSVNTFWSRLYTYFPKPEFNIVGATFAESEARHAEAYSRLIEVLGLNDEFNKILSYPAFQDKLDTVDDAMDSQSSVFTKMLFFTIVVEGVSLFAQFANILSFTRFKGIMKNIANIVQWTAQDENCHINFGITVVKQLIKEGHQLDEEQLKKSIEKYLEVEIKFMDWIYENGTTDFFDKEDMKNFMRYRVDDSLTKIGLKKVYNITGEQYKNMRWFDEEIFANTLDDFFAKRPVDYTKHDKAITSDDLF